MNICLFCKHFRLLRLDGIGLCSILDCFIDMSSDLCGYFADCCDSV